MRKNQGFTLIELMIVIAILGILLAIAIPAYQDYTIRTKVGEGLSVAAGAKLGVTETYQSGVDFTGMDNDAAGLAAANQIQGDNVSQVDVTNGIITITYGNDAPAEIASQTLALSPLTYAGSVDWICGTGGGTTSVPNRYLPSQCR